MLEESEALSAQMIQIQEDACRRLSCMLYDEAGHAATMALLRLELELRRLPPDAPARADLAGMRERLLAGAEGLYDIALALWPRVLDDLGLPAALRTLANRVSLAGAPDTMVEVVGDPQTLDGAVALTVFRAVQEALTGARAHAPMSRVQVVLHYSPPQLRVHIDDDGADVSYTASVAARATPVRATRGLGSAELRKRVSLLGGTLTGEVRRGGGTRLQIALPLNQQSNKGR